ncbi:MAG TPA: Npt1/Npt2 family nucleotide transporter [Steroidobacteraceae bacterium]|nr:Npt1/Npt2 family nucleotide transporter [Steroidobacteraceae bacterium]
MSNSEGSLLAGLLRKSTKIEADEMPAVIAAFVLFFAVFAGYFAVRPVRETVGTILGRQRVSDLFVVTWIVSIGVVMLYATLVARIRRAVLLPAIYGGVAVLLAAIGVALKSNPQGTVMPAVFYVLISVLNLFIVSVFWSFLLEIFSKDQTKRLFGVIAVGGTAGALVGPVTTDLVVGSIGNSGVLFMGAGLFVVAILCQRTLIHQGTIFKARQAGQTAATSDDRPVGSANPFAGLMLVLKSPYLLGIAVFMVLLSSVTTFLYLEQLDIVKRTFSDPSERTQIFSRLDYIVQSLTIVLQFFVTGRIAQRFGVVTLLTVVPLLMVVSFLGLAASGTFAVLAVAMVLRRVGEYAFIRPGREMLYSVVDTETKYKAKSFNDVPVYRGGDALSAQVQDLLVHKGFSSSSIAVLGAVIAAAWGFTAWRLGRKVK